MKKRIKYMLRLAVIIAIASLITSCGLFKKGCDCPKFGKVNTSEKVAHTS
jgi:hypothetical protein